MAVKLKYAEWHNSLIKINITKFIFLWKIHSRR